jgi:PAS domain S-box-containing protein
MDKFKSLLAIIGAWIKNKVAPPVFEDEEKTRIARILSIILWAVIAVVSGLIITWLVTEKSDELGPYAYAANTVIVGVALSLLFLIRSGHVKIASFIFIFFLWGNITFQALTSDGVRGSASIIYMAIMVLASLLLGWRASIGFAFLSTGFIWTLAHFEMIGFTTFQLDGPYEVALETTGIFVFTAILLTLTTTGLSNALQRARKSEHSLKISNRALQNNLKKLRLAGETLQESEARYRELVENANSIILRFDTQGRVTFFNDYAQSFFGYTEEEILHQNIVGTIIPETESSGRDLVVMFEDIIRNPAHYMNNENENIRRNGERVWIAWTNKAIVDQKGRISEILSIGMDITKRRTAEKETKNLEAQLRKAQKMEAIGTLAGGIAHDFNNILSAVFGYTEMALDKASEGTTLQGYMREVLTAGHRARDLVKQILAFSRQAEQEVLPVQVKLIAKEVIRLLRASLPTTIEIRRNFQNEQAVLADPTQIYQVLMNLCTNAGHAMRKKGGILEISLTNVELDTEFVGKHPGLEPGPYLRLTVDDSGLGMPADVMERIFDPYFTTKVKGGGTGLGLAVVHGIVKDRGGTITVDSEPGKGATFHVYLPVNEGKAKPAAKTNLPLALGDEHILFIDDEEAIAELGKEMLERCGYKVTTLTSGIEALELFKARPDKFDLVITDLTMPNMTGKELAKEVLHDRPQIPVILCTGFSEMITEKSAKAMGIRAFLMKPLTMHDLAGTVRKLLDESRS